MSTQDPTRLRSALTEILSAVYLTEAHAIAAKALEPPPKPPCEYAEAETLADLDPHGWRIVGRWTRHGTVWCIPLDEVATLKERRSLGQFTSTQARQGDHFVILARRLLEVPDARPMLRKVISKERNSL